MNNLCILVLICLTLTVNSLSLKLDKHKKAKTSTRLGCGDIEALDSKNRCTTLIASLISAESDSLHEFTSVETNTAITPTVDAGKSPLEFVKAAITPTTLKAIKDKGLNGVIYAIKGAVLIDTNIFATQLIQRQATLLVAMKNMGSQVIISVSVDHHTNVFADGEFLVHWQGPVLHLEHLGTYGDVKYKIFKMADYKALAEHIRQQVKDYFTAHDNKKKFNKITLDDAAGVSCAYWVKDGTVDTIKILKAGAIQLPLTLSTALKREDSYYSSSGMGKPKNYYKSLAGACTINEDTKTEYCTNYLASIFDVGGLTLEDIKKAYPENSNTHTTLTEVRKLVTDKSIGVGDKATLTQVISKLPVVPYELKAGCDTMDTFYILISNWDNGELEAETVQIKAIRDKLVKMAAGVPKWNELALKSFVWVDTCTVNLACK